MTFDRTVWDRIENYIHRLKEELDAVERFGKP